MKSIGEFLRKKRLEKKLSLREAAHLTGISHVHIRTIEIDEASPSFEKTLAMLNAYHVTVQELQNETGYTLAANNILRARMPDEFIKRLNADIQKQGEDFWDKPSIPKELLQSVLQGSGIISRRDVIEIAHILNQPIHEYLMLSEYLPEEFEIIKHSSAFDMFRTLNKLSPEEIEQVLQALHGVLSLYVQKKPEKESDN